jgi:hypothetical protein
VIAGSRYAIVVTATDGNCFSAQSPFGDTYLGGNAYFDSRPNAPGWVGLVGGRLDLPFQTIVEPGEGPGVQLPRPIVRLLGSETDVDGPGNNIRRYLLSVDNWTEYPEDLWLPAPDLEPCGLTADASRTWVTIRGPQSEHIYGFCRITSSDALTRIWFAIPLDAAPPAFVTVELWDRQSDVRVHSEPVFVGQH